MTKTDAMATFSQKPDPSAAKKQIVTTAPLPAWQGEPFDPKSSEWRVFCCVPAKKAFFWIILPVFVFESLLIVGLCIYLIAIDVTLNHMVLVSLALQSGYMLVYVLATVLMCYSRYKRAARDQLCSAIGMAILGLSSATHASVTVSILVMNVCLDFDQYVLAHVWSVSPTVAGQFVSSIFGLSLIVGLIDVPLMCWTSVVWRFYKEADRQTMREIEFADGKRPYPVQMFANDDRPVPKDFICTDTPTETEVKKRIMHDDQKLIDENREKPLSALPKYSPEGNKEEEEDYMILTADGVMPSPALPAMDEDKTQAYHQPRSPKTNEHNPVEKLTNEQKAAFVDPMKDKGDVERATDGDTGVKFNDDNTKGVDVAFDWTAVTKKQ